MHPLLRSLSLGVLGAAAFAGTTIAAHDFWIEPSQFAPAINTALSLALRVGVNFHGDAVPRIPTQVERFVIAGPDGALRSVDGRDGYDPAGYTTLPAPGLYVVGYRSRPSSVELEATKFETYLREEGLESIIEQRQRSGRSHAMGLEIYSRCAKTIIATPGAARYTGHDRVLGLRLELIPETSPVAARSTSMTFRLLYEGQPLAGALVVAMERQTAASPTATKPSARSDKTGRVTLPLTRGVWLVKAVHMVPAPKGIAAEWESVWASVTFELSPAVRS